MTLRPLLTSCPNYQMLLTPNPPHPLLGLFLPQNLSSLCCSHFHGTPFFSLTPATALAALPPRVWVGSAAGLVWLARKINSLPTDGAGVRRRGGAAERLIPRRGAGAVCRHRVNMLLRADRQPPVCTYPTLLGLDLGLVRVILCWRN